jgi:phosphoenolpyruvate synthase/pyruvate phosphate dikinase
MSENGPVTYRLNDEQLQIVAEATLRRMDHLEWLRMLAATLEQAPNRRGIPMTPFRSGAIERLRLAVKYIELLHREARDYERAIAALEDEIVTLKGEEGR